MAYDVTQLLAITQTQFGDLFRASPAGEIPDGPAEGTAIIAPGTKFSATIAKLINYFSWQGKVFDARKGVLKNKILTFGLEAVLARVYTGPSWLDGKDCVVLDYSETSMLAHYVRDEIRLIGPGFYLGKVYWGKDRLIDFCLKF